ncbi:MAG: peptidase M28 [Actinomycetota bacterium]|nr:peptidase M28 [Actinomycetota bacterium]
MSRPAEQGYPRQQVLAEPPVNDADAAIRLGLTPYHDIAPVLNDLQAASDRVSVEILGQSVRGRDLYLVTLTSPESPGEALRQAQLRDRIQHQASEAARDRSIPHEYKAPVFVNNNIHGNEWEGTDAALRVIEDLATSTEPAVDRLLDRSRLYFVVTMNPDGRAANTRANGNGFDMNRDFATGSQPEVRAVRQSLIGTQPLVMLDIHGYVNGTLIEPTTPPHGENYEYDLFIKHAYPNGLAMEKAVNGLGYIEAADGVRPVQIPFRDFPEGWDDWPPIFTPQYAAFHGAISHTIEIPLRVNNASYSLPVEELRRRSAINTDVAEATIRAAIAFTDDNRAQLIADQIEMFRRGAAGEAQRPVASELFPEIGPEDVYTTTFPRAYVIPVGASQRSAPAAARLVDHLIANDVEVLRADKPFRAGGQSYPAGSYVVDMHQPKRGMANVLLDDGSDISDRVDQMYDISGWSHRLLWGASVDVVERGDLTVSGRQVQAAAPSGAVHGTGDLALRLDDAKDFQALDALLDADVEVRWVGADGVVVVPAAARALAVQLADRFGVVFHAATGAGGVRIDDVAVAAAAPADELFALAEMGFDVRPVSTAALNAGFDWHGVDVLYVSSGLAYTSLDPAARERLREFLATGGGVVTRGATGATFNTDAGLLTATRVAGRRDANGVVRVANAGGPVTVRATPHTFVSGPSWFTQLGPEVAVEQRYGDVGPLVSGHWRATSTGDGGPAAARGQAVVVRGFDETGAGVVLFGSEPLYRAHPKGQYALSGHALLWATTAAP